MHPGLDWHSKHPWYSSHVFVEQSSPSQGSWHEHTGSPISVRTHAPLPLQYTSLLHAAPASAVASVPPALSLTPSPGTAGAASPSPASVSAPSGVGVNGSPSSPEPLDP